MSQVMGTSKARLQTTFVRQMQLQMSSGPRPRSHEPTLKVCTFRLPLPLSGVDQDNDRQRPHYRYAPEIVIRKAYEADSYGNQDIAGAESPFQHTSEDTAEAQDDPDGFDDDFDAFEEGGEGGEDDFGAFDDGDDEVARSPDQQSSSISSLPAPQSLLVSRDTQTYTSRSPYFNPNQHDSQSLISKVCVA